jgi:hypothetical protein
MHAIYLGWWALLGQQNNVADHGAGFSLPGEAVRAVSDVRRDPA